MRIGPLVAAKLENLGMRIVAAQEATAAGHITARKFSFRRGMDKNVEGIITHFMNRTDIDLSGAHDGHAAATIEDDILHLATRLAELTANGPLTADGRAALKADITAAVTTWLR